MTDDQTKELNNVLWDEMARPNSGGPEHVCCAFWFMLRLSVSRAKAHGVCDKEITELLIDAAADTRDQPCRVLRNLFNGKRPEILDEHRLSRLLHKAYGLIMSGDEDEIEKRLQWEHREGRLSKWDLRSELVKIGIKI
jgi:hypothetical protein